MPIFTAIIAAAIPTAIYSMLIWWLDRYEKEPLSLIAVAFLWGSLPAITLAIVFEFVLAVPLANSPLGPDVATWGVAPLVEEPVKALALVGLFLFARREFDGTLDGIVYGSLVGFGFSMTENVLYFMSYGSHDSQLEAIFWVRSVLFGLNHAFFTSLVGLALGPMRYDRTLWRSLLALAAGLTLAILFHSLHNFAIRYQSAGLFVSWLIQSGGVIVVLAIAVLAWRHERHSMELELVDEIQAGVLTADDYTEIMSSLKRVRRQSDALLTRGWSRYRQVRRLHHLATELAFCKSHLRLEDHYYSCDDRDRLRQEIRTLRAALNREETAWGKP
jgi:protease PrsW